MEWTVAVAQIAPYKGDYERNVALVGAAITQALDEAETPPVDVLVFPETALTGYFLEGAVQEVARSQDEVVHDLWIQYQATLSSLPLDLVIGFIERANGSLYNTALYVSLGQDGARVIHAHRKFFLPSYGVFDEARYLTSGRHIDAFETRFGRAGILICEDAWHAVMGTILAAQKVGILYIISASPARDLSGPTIGNALRWHAIARGMAAEHGIFVVTANLVGFEGGKGFIGSSLIVDPRGEPVVEASLGGEELMVATLDQIEIDVARAQHPLLGDMATRLPDLIRALQKADNLHER